MRSLVHQARGGFGSPRLNAALVRVVADAREPRIRYRLKSGDALHLACAAAGRADGFRTNDGKILAVGEHSGVPIQPSIWPGDMPLDFNSGD